METSSIMILSLVGDSPQSSDPLVAVLAVSMATIVGAAVVMLLLNLGKR